MRRLTRLVSVGAITVTALGLVAQPAFAHDVDDDHKPGAQPAVFVPTNDPAGNQVVAYNRGADGNQCWSTG